MEFTTLGRTGLRVSRMGLGCGGHSRLGQATGHTETESIRIVQEALGLGVNFIDTAESYGTEEIVGKAVQGLPRHSFVISTKVGVERDGRRSTPEEYRERVLGCLRRLRLEQVDVLHVHGLSVDHYPYAIEQLVPVIQELRAEGRVRFIGVTEAFGPDPGHRMMSAAGRDDCWDVIMVGFNILNQSARERVLPWTRARNVGTLDMFAVRRALSQPDRLSELARQLRNTGEIDAQTVDLDDPLGFILKEGAASNVTEAAYRFCLGEPGIDVVLSGTGSIDHLRENARYLSMPPLPESIIDRLRKMFERVDSVSGN